jgi:hypothetical protein
MADPVFPAENIRLSFLVTLLYEMSDVSPLKDKMGDGPRAGLRYNIKRR